MNQARMLHEAVQKAIQGGRVIITGFSSAQTRLLRDLTRQSVGGSQLRQVSAEHLGLTSGGDLRFVHLPNLDQATLAFSGWVYVTENGEEWEETQLRSPPPPPPKTRFERMNDDE